MTQHCSGDILHVITSSALLNAGCKSIMAKANSYNPYMITGIGLLQYEHSNIALIITFSCASCLFELPFISSSEVIMLNYGMLCLASQQHKTYTYMLKHTPV